MRKTRTALTVLALSAAALTGTTTGAAATDSFSTSRAAAAPCTVPDAFCATSGSGDQLVLHCGESALEPWSGVGYWDNRLPGGGIVKMFDYYGSVNHVAPADSGPTEINWSLVWALRTYC
ncbi:hypothetical protein AB0D24_25845 [Streptomyces javensis]|uniref:hypothetical protein n=1 Tax=Streptomyces javensis TaxID=114698 RepID=UPI0033FE730A